MGVDNDDLRLNYQQKLVNDDPPLNPVMNKKRKGILPR